jgi:hypothetical protein
MTSTVELEATPILRRVPSMAQRILGRFVAIAAMVAAWSGAMALHLEGVWLLFAPLAVMFASLFVVGQILAKLSHVVLTLGTDGVYIEQVLSRRFIPFAEIEGVTRGLSGAVTLRTKGAPPLVLHTAFPGGGRLDGLVKQIDDARTASLAAPPGSPPIFERGERSIRQWIAELRARATHETYRDTSFDVDRLWSMVESPSLEPSHRAAAAVALRDKLDDEGKARLRVAADACASPEVRVALEAAAEDDEEKLSSALERL